MNIICKFFTGMDQIFIENLMGFEKITKKIYVVPKIELIVNWPD